jgi:prevent-host-death family protein
VNISTKTPTTFTSREFNQDTARAKRAAEQGPVFITDRGRPAFVLMSIDDYREQFRTKPRSLAEALEQKEGGDFDFDIPEFKDSYSLRPVEFE